MAQARSDLGRSWPHIGRILPAEIRQLRPTSHHIWSGRRRFVRRRPKSVRNLRNLGRNWPNRLTPARMGQHPPQLGRNSTEVGPNSDEISTHLTKVRSASIFWGRFGKSHEERPQGLRSLRTGASSHRLDTRWPCRTDPALSLPSLLSPEHLCCVTISWAKLS